MTLALAKHSEGEQKKTSKTSNHSHKDKLDSDRHVLMQTHILGVTADFVSNHLKPWELGNIYLYSKLIQYNYTTLH